MVTSISSDFPAAHSMDTAWFAVDDAGEIALFDSNETGYVPKNAEGGMFWDDLFRHCPEDGKGLRRAPVDGRPLAVLCDPAKLAANLNVYMKILANGYIPRDITVVFACESDVIVPAPASVGVHIRFSGPDVMVRYDYPVPLAEIEQAAANGGVIAIAPGTDGVSDFEAFVEAQKLTENQVIEVSNKALWPYHSWPSNEVDEYWYYKYIGIHVYSVLEFYRTYYEATHRPHAPLKITDFAPEEIAHLKILPLPGIRFAEVGAVQPLAMMDCRSVVSLWMGVDSSVHIKQKYKDGKLYRADGTQFDDEALRHLTIRPVGTLPAATNTEKWMQLLATLPPDER